MTEEVYMLFSNRFGMLVVVCVAMMMDITPSVAERIDRGTQVIDGTRVNTVVYHERGYAVFENSCGSQRLTQSQLQNGAKPTNIIPCPRSNVNRKTTVPRGISRGYYGAVAISTEDQDLSWGAANNHRTATSAEAAALAGCYKHSSSCKLIGSFSNGGCGVLATGRSSSGTTWAIGSDSSDVLARCQRGYGGDDCTIRYRACAGKPD